MHLRCLLDVTTPLHQSVLESFGQIRIICADMSTAALVTVQSFPACAPCQIAAVKGNAWAAYV